MTLPIFKDHNPSNPWIVAAESHTVAANGTVKLVYAPKKGTIVITGFTETLVTSPGLTEFYCDYQDATDYRTASQIVQFSLSQAGNSVTFAYQGVSQTVDAVHMNELKDHEENAAIHLTTMQAEKINDAVVTTDTRLSNQRIPTDASVTDVKLGNRTVDQSTAVASANTGELTQMLSWFAKQLKAITGMTNWYDLVPASLATLWNLKWNQGFILFNPADLYVSPGIPLSRNGTMTTMDFYVTGTPTAATMVTVKQNGTALAPTVSLSASGKATLTFTTAVTGTADDLFSYSVAGGGLSACTVVANGKWGNR